MTDRPPARPHYYDALKVSQDAPAEVIRAAYRSLSQKYHPDRNAGDECAHVMAALNQAYEVLSHPVKKQEYDSWIRRESVRTRAEAEGESDQKQMVARRPRRWREAITRKRVAAGVSALACCAAVAAYSTAQNADPWLERAWQESWRGGAPVTSNEQSTLLSFSRAGAAADPASAAVPALKWENGLNSSASHTGRDVRF